MVAMTSELRKAVEAMASAVRKVEDLADKPAWTPGEKTHVEEFLPQMESMLIDQMATSVGKRSEQSRILAKYELDHLQDELDGENLVREGIEAELDSQ